MRSARLEKETERSERCHLRTAIMNAFRDQDPREIGIFYEFKKLVLRVIDAMGDSSVSQHVAQLWVSEQVNNGLYQILCNNSTYEFSYAGPVILKVLLKQYSK